MFRRSDAQSQFFLGEVLLLTRLLNQYAYFECLISLFVGIPRRCTLSTMLCIKVFIKGYCVFRYSIRVEFE